MSRKKKNNVPNIDVPTFLRDAASARLDDPDSKARWPHVYDVLVPRWEGITQTYSGGRLTIQVDGASWRLSVDIATALISTSLHVITLTEALDKLELALSEDQLFWGPSWSKRKKKLPTLDDVI